MARATMWLGLCGVMAATALGCASASAPAGAQTASAGPSHPPGERIWRSKCGACHVPVQPQARERAYLETALSRHRVRLRLSEPEWAQVVEFLAKPASHVATSR